MGSRDSAQVWMHLKSLFNASRVLHVASPESFVCHPSTSIVLAKDGAYADTLELLGLVVPHHLRAFDLDGAPLATKSGIIVRYTEKRIQPVSFSTEERALMSAAAMKAFDEDDLGRLTKRSNTKRLIAQMDAAGCKSLSEFGANYPTGFVMTNHAEKVRGITPRRQFRFAGEKVLGGYTVGVYFETYTEMPWEADFELPSDYSSIVKPPPPPAPLPPPSPRKLKASVAAKHDYDDPLSWWDE